MSKEIELTPAQELLKLLQIDQNPAQAGTFGIEEAKKALDWFGETYAEVLVTIREGGFKKGIKGTFEFIKRFGDNLLELKPLLSKLEVVFDQFGDIDNEEATELENHFNWRIAKEFEKVGLDIEDNSAEIALLALKMALSFV